MPIILTDTRDINSMCAAHTQSN